MWSPQIQTPSGGGLRRVAFQGAFLRQVAQRRVTAAATRSIRDRVRRAAADKGVCVDAAAAAAARRSQHAIMILVRVPARQRSDQAGRVV